MNLDKLKKEIDIIDGIKHDLKNLIADYNKIIKRDLPFIHRGIKYPANWLRLTTLDEKKAIGLVEVPD